MRAPKASAAIAAAVERPMPGSVASVAASRGKVAAVLGDHTLRRGVQMMRAAVIAQATPQREHAIDRRGGERAHIGERLDEAQEVRDHRRHLRLLQHDLRQPDAVRDRPCSATGDRGGRACAAR